MSCRTHRIHREF
jgi:predicted transposase YdaD